MQRLTGRWKVGRVYHFVHSNGAWEGDVQILGYKDRDMGADGLEYWGYCVEVALLGEHTPKVFEGARTVVLNADHDWGVNEVAINLENE